LELTGRNGISAFFGVDVGMLGTLREVLRCSSALVLLRIGFRQLDTEETIERFDASYDILE